MKTKQRQHRMDLEQDKSVAEKQLRREYYHQAQEMSVQRMRDFYAWKEQSRNTLGVQAKDALLTTPSRMADASTAQDVLFLTTQVTELQAEKDNTQTIQQQLQDEIHVLQDQLVQTAHESYQAKTLHHDNQTHVKINAQLKERINMLEQEATSTHEYKMQAMAKDRTVLSLQNAVKNAKHEAEIQRKKGYEEALKSMEQDIVGLHTPLSPPSSPAINKQQMPALSVGFCSANALKNRVINPTWPKQSVVPRPYKRSPSTVNSNGLRAQVSGLAGTTSM
jgi:hypothetical protein